MDQEESSYINQTHPTEKTSDVEHCSFQWTIKAFLSKRQRGSSSLATLLFSACDNDETFTLWQVDLISYGPQSDDIHIELTRLKSQNTSQVFVRFHWEILDADRNRVFPGSINSFVYPSDKISKRFVQTDCLSDDRFLADGDLHVLCELSAYGREVEDAISSEIRGGVPYGLCVLSEDMEKAFSTESAVDVYLHGADFVMPCHKSILIARSEVFAEMIKARMSEQHFYLGKMKADSLHAILMHLYCGNIDMYLKHTIPKDLYFEAQKYELHDLRNHLDFVNSSGLTTLKSIDVTWKLPHFSTLILQPEVTLYCPEPSSSTFYDNRWCFKFEFDSSRDGVDISVIRKQEENYTHIVKFVVRIEAFGKTAFEKINLFTFYFDGVQGMNAFLTKKEISGLVSFEDTLVLKCSLEVLRCYRKIYSQESPEQENTNIFSNAVHLFKTQTEESLFHLSEDLNRLFDSEMFSDVIAITKLGERRYHSFIAEARFSTPTEDLKEFLKNLNPKLVDTFFHFIYSGDILASRAASLQSSAEYYNLLNVMDKLSDFLALTDE